MTGTDVEVKGNRRRKVGIIGAILGVAAAGVAAGVATERYIVNRSKRADDVYAEEEFGVWDFDEGGSPLSLFWTAARDLDTQAPGEATLPGTRRGHLAHLLDEAGVDAIEQAELVVEVQHQTFEEWWQPFELGVGPAGGYAADVFGGWLRPALAGVLVAWAVVPLGLTLILFRRRGLS